MCNKPGTCLLTVVINGNEYVLGCLSFNKNKNELFYFFAYDSNMNLGQPDHISWHQDGKHIKKRKDASISIKDQYCVEPIKINFIPSSKQLKPLLVESLNLNGSNAHIIPSLDAYYLTNKQWKNTQKKIVTTLKNCINFSMTLFLIPSDHALEDYDIQTTASRVELNQVFLSIGRIEFFNEWDVLVGISPWIEPNAILKNSDGPQLSLSIENPAASINAMIVKNLRAECN